MRKNIGELQKVMKQENICKLKSKSKTIFPQKIEDSSLDFTANVEISLTQSDFSLPNSLKDSKQFNSPEKKEESPKQKQFFQKSFETRKISETIKIDMKSFENSTCNFTFSISKNKILIINEFNRKMLRLYQIWPSNNRFFLKGRLICGPKTDNCHFLFVLFLIVGVSLVFFILVIPYLWEFVSPILPCFITYLFLSTLIFLFFTTFTDPGIIPRKKVFELFGGIPPAFNETHHNEQIIDKNKRNKKEKKINKRRQKKKYCSTCEIFRPSRASHCNDCGNCVEVFDHHCPFVNNCIGKRNYKYFLGFLISLVLLGVSEIAGFLIRLITIFGQGADNVNQSTVINNSTLVLVVICVIAIPTGLLIICVSILCCFHLHLVIKGKTTKESRKNIKIEDDDRKQTVNWCKSDPPLFNFRQILNEDQIEFLKKKSHSPAGNSHH